MKNTINNSVLNFLIFLSLLNYSCWDSETGTKEKTKEYITMSPSEGVEYISDANGVAYIYLLIKGDNTFHFEIRIFPEPMQEGAKEEFIESEGTWASTENGWVRLFFKNKKISVASLFDKKYSKKDDFKVIDEHTVEINQDKDEISIWGIICLKQ